MAHVIKTYFHIDHPVKDEQVIKGRYVFTKGVLMIIDPEEAKKLEPVLCRYYNVKIVNSETNPFYKMNKSDWQKELDKRAKAEAATAKSDDDEAPVVTTGKQAEKKEAPTKK